METKELNIKEHLVNRPDVNPSNIVAYLQYKLGLDAGNVSYKNGYIVFEGCKYDDKALNRAVSEVMLGDLGQWKNAK